MRTLKRRQSNLITVIESIDVVLFHLRREKTARREMLWGLHQELFAEFTETNRLLDRGSL